MFVFVCILAFIVSFIGSAVFKMTYVSPEMKKYTVKWTDEIGKIYTDLSYGEKPANKFDLYVPADNTKETYGLIVYLHAGGFTTGDKADDAKMLQWLCSLGYVTAGINYTLFSEENPNANIYTQSMEIKESIPYVIAEAGKLGYKIDRMAMSGGSAGGCLALLYAYRDAADAPVPVKMVFEGVGPSSFYPEDWKCYGFDQNMEAAAGMFSVMTGKAVTVDLFGTPEYDELVKDTSALYWVNENTVPTVMAYGAHDKFQPYEGSVRLDAALTEHGVPHEYIVFEHSGHGLQNDNKQMIAYSEAILDYLGRYMSN
ncbi:MAG: alpha/beta hydrolase [Eubacteriales bacterium]|nr:alpha/beta hydrolase [Eubacteriales bacterium]